ncbi:MAG: HEPN domain-containing protein [Bacteroidia bacterium]
MEAITEIKEIETQKAFSEFQVSNFFKNYPIEYVQEKIAFAFEKVLPKTTENPTLASIYLFYEELNLVLKNCEFLSKIEQHHLLHNHDSLNTIVCFLKEIIPVSYIFCSHASVQRTDLIIVLDQYKYKPIDEIHTLLDFSLLGHKNINCTVYSYAVMNEFLLNGHLYFSALCIPENCVYKNPKNYTLPRLAPDKYHQLVDSARQSFYENMERALTFFGSAHQLSNEISVFMLQQACELTFRSLLLSLRGKDVRCHDLVVLRKNLKHFVPTLDGVFGANEKQEIKLLGLIQEAYIRSRYDQSYSISRTDLEHALIATRKFIDKAYKIFNHYCLKIQLASCPISNQV